MEWRRNTRKYANGHLLYAGKWSVGGVHYDSCLPQGAPARFNATCRLPGVKSDLGHFKTEEEAEKRVEEVVRYWLSGLAEGEEA